MKERVRKYAILEELLQDKEKQLEFLVSELYVSGCWLTTSSITAYT